MYATCLDLVGCEPASASAPGLGSNSNSNSSLYDLVRRVFDEMPNRNVIAWNIMVSWYVKTGRFVTAVEQLKLMMSLGIKPTVVSFVNVFPAISRIRDVRNANVLYGMLIRYGSAFVNDLFCVSSAIFMFSELGRLEFAREIFNRCLNRNPEILNTMISGYIQKKSFPEGIELFVQSMVSEQALLDDVTILLALTAVSQLQELSLGQQLHAYVVKKSGALHVRIFNALIVMYSRCGNVETAFKAFEKMRERDVVSWNTMVSAFVQNGLDDEGLMLVCEMQKRQLKIDSVAVIAILSATSNLRDQETGKQTHAYLLRHGIQAEGIDSYLIDAYAKCGLIETAARLFANTAGCDRDSATWNAMIAGYMQNGLIERALVVFRQMLAHNLIPNSVSLVSILPACNPMGCVALGMQLHAFAIRHFLDQNVYVSTALVDMYSKSGAIAYAEKVFSGAPERNSVTYTNMMLGYGQHGMGGKALSLFCSLRGHGIQPNAIAFVAILSACSHSGFVDEGLHLFDSMKREYNIRPSAEHYSCVVDMLGRAGRVSEAYEFVEGLGEEGNVLGIWGSLLGACKLHKEFELGKTVADKLLEMEPGSRTMGYHVLLSNIYAEQGNWSNVDSLRKVMRGKHLQKEPGSSWIEVAGCVNRFVSRDQKHQKCDEIYKTLGELNAEMEIAGYRPCIGSRIADISEYDP